jgi:hypothetical protein
MLADESKQTSAPDQRRERMDAWRAVSRGRGDVGDADAEEPRAAFGELGCGGGELSP